MNGLQEEIRPFISMIPADKKIMALLRGKR
jgi:hypothetical protein